MNSTETPGGSGIPAGWYDDPSGQGLRWWDGEQWTEHVHTAESAAAAAGDDRRRRRSREGKPPRDLVKLRESIRARGAKGVGIVLGAIVVRDRRDRACSLSGGSDNNERQPGPGGDAAPARPPRPPPTQAQIKAINKQLKNKNLSKAQKKAARSHRRRSFRRAVGREGQVRQERQAGRSEEEVTPGEEGN